MPGESWPAENRARKRNSRRRKRRNRGPRAAWSNSLESGTGVAWPIDIPEPPVRRPPEALMGYPTHRYWLELQSPSEQADTGPVRSNGRWLGRAGLRRVVEIGAPSVL